MTTYRCSDEGASIDIEAETPEDAAQEFVDGGTWETEENKTVWVDVSVVEIDDDGEEIGDYEEFEFTLDPDPPTCSEAEEHDFVSPIELVGGIEENPGVWGHGGGVTIKSVCRHCGVYELIDTWAQGPHGRQGLREVSYSEADEESLAWVEEQRTQ